MRLISFLTKMNNKNMMKVSLKKYNESKHHVKDLDPCHVKNIFACRKHQKRIVW